MPQHALALQLGVGRAAQPLEHRLGLAGARMDERDRLTDRLLHRIAEQPAGRGIPQLDHACAVQPDDRVTAVANNGAQPVAQLGRLTLGRDVLRQHHQAIDMPLPGLARHELQGQRPSAGFGARRGGHGAALTTEYKGHERPDLGGQRLAEQRFRLGAQRLPSGLAAPHFVNVVGVLVAELAAPDRHAGG